MEIDFMGLANAAVASAMFSAIGIAFFALAFGVIRMVTPFSVRKEIEEDQNVALGIVIGSVLLGIGMIVSSAMHGEEGGAAAAGIDWNTLINAGIASSLFSLVGLMLFGLIFFLITKVLPFSVRKEIEEDHNVALAIVLAAVNLGVAWIVSAAVRG
jgi:uncharacterized membrane protein YjfL (UPF0719 family)